MTHARTLLTILSLAALLSPALPAMAEEARSPLEDAKQVVKDGARAVGDATRDTTKAIGHETRDVTKAIGHESRDAVHTVGDAIKNAWKSLTGSDEPKAK